MARKGPDIADGLIRGAVEILRPIVRQLLATNVPLGRLVAGLRELFVEVAERDFPLADRPQTDSRIALLTGINRKEIRRIRSRDDDTPAPMVFSRNRAASLISRWTTGATERDGSPRALPYRSDRGASFVRFVREVAADLPPRAILDELVRTGAVRVGEGGRVELVTDGYVPVIGRPEKLQMLAEDPPELIQTMLHNIFSESGDLLLQRKVFFDNLGREGVERVRSEMRREGERFLRRVNRLLARHDRDRNPRAAGGERYSAGIGVYFFETPSPPAATSVGRRSRKARRAKSRSKEASR